MLRASVSRPNSPIQIETAPRPTPQSGEVVVKVQATALNFADLLMIKGRYQDNPPFPLTPGLEVAGTVAAKGPNTDGISVESRVLAQTPGGGLAEYVAVSAEQLVEVPEQVSDTTACAFPIAYGTSHLALVRRARLEAGETLVVLGAAGGVGLTAVEIGKSLGARVIAVARGEERLSICAERGADICINSDEIDDLRASILAHGRAHVVYDAIGGPEGLAAQRCLAPEGRHLLIGFASGDLPELKPNHLLVKNLDVIGVNWSQYTKEYPALVHEILSELLVWIGSGKLTPHIGATYPLAEAAKALERLRSRQVVGKIVVTP